MLEKTRQLKREVTVMRPLLALLVVLLVLASAAFGVGVGFGVVAQRVSDGFSGSVALGCLTLFASTVLALWQFDRTKRKEAEARIFALRAPVYVRLVAIIREFLFTAKGWAVQRDQEEVAKELAEITYDMIVWGGQDTIRAVMKLSEMSQDEPEAIFRTIQNLFRAIRKDLGHSDDAALPVDLVAQLIIPEERDDIRRILS